MLLVAIPVRRVRGAPVAQARSSGALIAAVKGWRMTARATLTGTALQGLLERLGFRPEDAADLLTCLDALDAADWTQVDHLHALLADRVGRLDERPNPLEGQRTDHPVAPDLLALAALVATGPLVRDELVRRGLPSRMAWASASDLGQQVHIHRVVHGRFGLGSTGWVAPNYAGGLVWLGRLQYTLEKDEEFGWVLGCHIPESGPLTPAAVDASLRLARDLAVPAFGDFPLSRVVCASWLLDRNLADRLDPASNFVRFSRRFTPYGTPRDGRRDALFFGFHRETAGGQQVELTALPRDTSLHRAILAQLDAGGVVAQPGWLPFPAEEQPFTASMNS